MEIMQSLKNMVRTLRGSGDDETKNIKALWEVANKWKPRLTLTSYDKEIDDRILFYSGSMQSDTEEFLKKRYKETFKDMALQQINLNIVEHKIKEKAQVFCSRSTFSLQDASGDQQALFEKILEDAQIHVILKELDRRVTLCHRYAAKAYWDGAEGRARVTLFAPNTVGIVPDPDRHWDANSALAQIFRIPGSDGIFSNPRYEFWSIVDGETMHVEATDKGTNTYENNDDAIIPFVDPTNGRPIYPMTWFADDASPCIYELGDEDFLTVNRAVNCQYTDFTHAMKYRMFGVNYASMAQGSTADFPAKTVIAPNEVLILPSGATVGQMSNNMPITEIHESIKALIGLDLMLAVGSASAIREGGTESGYAIKLRNRKIIEHRQDMIEIYRPKVVELVRKICIVHNTYNQANPINITNAQINWVPGDTEISQDDDALGLRYSQEIINNVSTAIDWRMERYGEDRRTAEAAVRANKIINDEISKRPI